MLHLIVQAIKVLMVAALAFVMVGSARAALTHFSTASNPPDRTVTFVVGRNEPSTQVAQALQAAGLIHSTTVFRLELKLSNPTGGLTPGSYQLNTGMTVSQIITALSRSPAATPTP
ncbi:MAG TPA: endolytic transglycosylase MltG [Thermomicrobiaceae bacterium]|nr:endolytic transglycosylase MltG [Thermomicrobiaceae bacterium]